MVEYAEHLQTEKAKTAASKDTQPVVPGRPDCVLEKFRCIATNSFFIAYACLNSCDGEARGWGNQTGHSPSMVEYAEHLQTEKAKTAASKDTQPVVPGRPDCVLEKFRCIATNSCRTRHPCRKRRANMIQESRKPKASLQEEMEALECNGGSSTCFLAKCSLLSLK